MTAVRPSSARSNCLFYYHAIKLSLVSLNIIPPTPYQDIIYFLGQPNDIIINLGFTINYFQYASDPRA